MAAIREDWTAVEELDAHFNAARRASIEERLAPARAAEKNALANLRLKSGLAVLCIGAAIGLACFGASYVIQPKIIEKPVVTEKLVYVDKPIVTEKIVTVEKSVIVEKLIPSPTQTSPSQIRPAQAKPALSRTPRSEDEFTQQESFKNAEYHGIIESYVNGNMTFRGGKTFYHARGNVIAVRPELIGKQAYCEEFNSQEHRYHCYAWINGRQEAI